MVAAQFSSTFGVQSKTFLQANSLLDANACHGAAPTGPSRARTACALALLGADAVCTDGAETAGAGAAGAGAAGAGAVGSQGKGEAVGGGGGGGPQRGREQTGDNGRWSVDVQKLWRLCKLSAELAVPQEIHQA